MGFDVAAWLGLSRLNRKPLHLCFGVLVFWRVLPSRVGGVGHRCQEKCGYEGRGIAVVGVLGVLGLLVVVGARDFLR